MSLWNNITSALLLGTVVLSGQQTSPKLLSVVATPADAPVRIETFDQGDSRVGPRGGAMVVDVHSSVTLRNTSTRRVRGLTLLVTAQEVTAGGKGSVSQPSLDIGPGETVSVRIDLQLLRPLTVPAAGTALAEVSVDGVLFDDLGFYGPNKLNCRRSMTVWELEARRDRKYFAGVLQRDGEAGLRQAMVESANRQKEQQDFSVRVAKGRVSALEAARPVEFAFVRTPGSPVEAEAGQAPVTASDIGAPKIKLTNKSARAVRGVEMGWVVRDRSGQEILATTIPARVHLNPGQSAEVPENVSLRINRKSGQPVEVAGMKGYVANVEYADEGIWVPERGMGISPEEQRLSQIFLRKGYTALVQELKKFEK
jgi:hypothetical protein